MVVDASSQLLGGDLNKQTSPSPTRYYCPSVSDIIYSRPLDGIAGGEETTFRENWEKSPGLDGWIDRQIESMSVAECFMLGSWLNSNL